MAPKATTRSRTRSGCVAPSAIVVMPPMEWPTSASGPSGATASMTALEVLAELGDRVGRPGAAPDRPWPRWSHTTTRYPAHRR